MKKKLFTFVFFVIAICVSLSISAGDAYATTEGFTNSKTITVGYLENLN